MAHNTNITATITPTAIIMLIMVVQGKAMRLPSSSVTHVCCVHDLSSARGGQYHPGAHPSHCEWLDA